MDDTNVLRFVVTDPNGKEITTTHEPLRSPSTHDVGWIPKSISGYSSASKSLSDKNDQALCFPTHLLLLQQGFLSLHNKLFHLLFTIMLRLYKFGILPKRFPNLRNNLLPCASYMFGQVHCRAQRHKPLRLTWAAPSEIQEQQLLEKDIILTN